ncbi:MAG: ABC transporter substrate-binding protein [Acidimicrobiales bacterium]|nr:ABC transporter substrate-binding protein [Acidimicrobiales bacterium]
MRFGRGAAVLGCAAGLFVAACGSPPSTGGGDGGRQANPKPEGKAMPTCPVKALDKVTGPVTVDVWYGGLGGSPEGVLKDMAKRFNASQDKVKVEVNKQGASYQEVLRKYEGASATPKQLPQIVYLEDRALGELVDKGQVMPAEACMKADGYDVKQIDPVARTSFSVDGVLYPGYMNVSTPVIYYNKIHFKEAGLDPEAPPKTFADIERIAKVLKQKGVSEEPLSFKSDSWFFTTWLSGMGVESVNNDNGRSAPPTKATFDTPEARKILTELQKMRKEGLVATYPVTEGSIDHYLALVQEKSSMLVETSTASSTIRDFLGGKLDAEAVGLGFSKAQIDKATRLVPGAGMLPGPEQAGQVYASGGAFYMLNTSSDAEQAGAWAFLKFMLEPENAIRWHTQAGYLPVVKEAQSSPEVENFWKTDVAGVMLKNAVEQLEDADPDRPGPLMGPYTAFTERMDAMLYDVMGPNPKDPAKALSSAQSDVDEILKKYND